MSQNKVKRTYLGLYVLAFIGVTVIFLMVGFTMVNVLGDYVQTEMMRSATYTARSYSHTMEKNMEAYDTVTELIEEKIETAADTLISVQLGQNPDLTLWAEKLNVDSIDVYDKDGVVIRSSIPGNVGWSVYEGHPVHEFYASELERSMGPIRVNTISGREFKYGYYRLESGGFLQIGVSADHIRSFADDFDMITSFNEMRNGNEKLHLTFLSLEGEVLASTEEGRSGEILSDESILEMLQREEETGVYTEIGEENVYQVYVPVYSEGIRRGTLAVAESTAEKDLLLRRLLLVSSFILLAIYGAFLFLFVSSYRRFKRLMNLAYFDQDSGLPNREHLRSYLEDERFTDGTKKALMLVRLFPHLSMKMEMPSEMGVDFMKEVETRLDELTSYPVHFFYLSENQFVLIAEEYRNKLDLIALIDQVTILAKQKFGSTATTEYMNITFGITEMDENRKSMKQLIKEAKVSLSSISDVDGVNYAFFSYHTGRKLQMEDMIAGELGEIIRDVNRGGVHLLYQPIISMKDGTVSSFEALARFTSKKYGKVPPEKFIEIAEKNNQILPLGYIIFTQAARYAKKMFDKGYSHVRVSVNISLIQLLHEDFLQRIVEIVQEEGIQGKHMILEIDESAFQENFSELNRKLLEIRKQGFLVALDNFGSAYSSLRGLKELNVDILKIDKKLIQPITPGESERYITRDLISLAHRLGMRVVAEGVELESQMEYLYHADCDCVQGYICGRPAKPEEASLSLISSPNSCWLRLMRRKYPILTEEDALVDEPDVMGGY